MINRLMRVAAVAMIFVVPSLSGNEAAARMADQCEDQWLGCFEDCESGTPCTVGKCTGVHSCIACLGSERGRICDMGTE
jgi:hypothetical protein